MAHTKLILKHLEDFGSITAAEAVDNYGCYRLAVRIADLKELGYEITSERERGKNRYGVPVCYARYRLVGRSVTHGN